MIDPENFIGQIRKANMRKSKTVILWGREDLLIMGFESYISERLNWEVIRISDNQSIDFLTQRVDEVNPDVVIIYQGDCASTSYLPAQLIQDHPGLKVITSSLENNLIEVYSKQKVMMKEVSDLLSVIEG